MLPPILVPRQGRRAGQPARRASEAQNDESFAFELPNVQRYPSGEYSGGGEDAARGGGPGGEGERRRRGSEAWGDSYPPLAAPPLLPAPLNERLAKLKLKMGRRTEENGAMNLPSGAVSAGGAPQPPQGPPPPMSSRSSRPISAASSTAGAGGDDALDSEVKRQALVAPSVGSTSNKYAADRQQVTPSPLPRPRVSSAGGTTHQEPRSRISSAGGGSHAS